MRFCSLSLPSQTTIWYLLAAALLNSNRDVVVVHGFTPVASPISKHNRLSSTSIPRRHSSLRSSLIQPRQRIMPPLSASSSSTTIKTSSTEESLELDSLLETILNESSSQPKSVSLRPALTFLRQHPSLKLSRSHWNAIFQAIQVVTTNAEENNGTTMPSFPAHSRARQEMTDMYTLLHQRQDLVLFGVAATSVLAAGPRDLLSPRLFETLVDLPLTALTPSPQNSNTVLWAGVAAACLEAGIAMVTGIPLNLLFLASLVFFFTDRILSNGAVLDTLLKYISPGTQQKILHHEAGHFLLAYLTGCPVEGTVLSAWAALEDSRFSRRIVQAGTSFYDPILADQINTKQQVTSSAIDRYSMIVMAGIAAEAEQYGTAEGGASDESALIALLSSCGIVAPEKIKTQARWGAVQAILLLRQYKPSYRALVEALERGGTLGDCMYAIEQAARTEGLPTQLAPLGYMRGNPIDGTPEWVAGREMKDTATEESNSINGAPNKTQELDTDAALSLLSDQRRTVEESLREVEKRLREFD